MRTKYFWYLSAGLLVVACADEGKVNGPEQRGATASAGAGAGGAGATLAAGSTSVAAAGGAPSGAGGTGGNPLSGMGGGWVVDSLGTAPPCSSVGQVLRAPDGRELKVLGDLYSKPPTLQFSESSRGGEIFNCRIDFSVPEVDCSASAKLHCTSPRATLDPTSAEALRQQLQALPLAIAPRAVRDSAYKGDLLAPALPTVDGTLACGSEALVGVRILEWLAFSDRVARLTGCDPPRGQYGCGFGPTCGFGGSSAAGGG